MKILHVIPSVGPLRGGTSTAVLGTVNALRTAGIDAEIVTTNDNSSELLNVPLGKKIEYEQVPVYFFSRFSPSISPLREFCFSADLTRWLWQHIQNYDLVEIHSLFSYACSCAGVISRTKKIPYIINVHGQFSPWVINQKRLKKEIYSFLVERGNLNNATAIHCTTVAESQDVINFGIQTPTFTVPLGIDKVIDIPEAKQKLHELYQIPFTTPIILFFSRIHPKKRPDLLLQSLSRLAEQKVEFHLILAGTGDADYVEYIVELATSLGLKKFITFPGFITDNKALFLQGSDIFVLPSFGENFGVAVAEAMAVGLPVVITPDVQISSEIADENAGIIVPGEIEPLAEMIKKLLVSPQLRQQLGANGKNLANQRYTWDTVAQSLVSVYELILKDRYSSPK